MLCAGGPVRWLPELSFAALRNHHGLNLFPRQANWGRDGRHRPRWLNRKQAWPALLAATVWLPAAVHAEL
jgi:hypothetical protein